MTTPTTRSVEERIMRFKEWYERRNQVTTHYHVMDWLRTQFTELAKEAEERGAREKVDILITVNEWLIARGDVAAAKELNDAMLKRFNITPNQ